MHLQTLPQGRRRRDLPRGVRHPTSRVACRQPRGTARRVLPRTARPPATEPCRTKTKLSAADDRPPRMLTTVQVHDGLAGRHGCRDAARRSGAASARVDKSFRVWRSESTTTRCGPVRAPRPGPRHSAQCRSGGASQPRSRDVRPASSVPVHPAWRAQRDGGCPHPQAAHRLAPCVSTNSALDLKRSAMGRGRPGPARESIPRDGRGAWDLYPRYPI